MDTIKDIWFDANRIFLQIRIHTTKIDKVSCVGNFLTTNIFFR